MGPEMNSIDLYEMSMTLKLFFLQIVNLKIILQIELIKALSYQDGY